MIYHVESDKSFIEVVADLEAVILRLGFAILARHDLGAALRGKGVDIDEECAAFEICHARLAGRLLALDMDLSLTLPWRITVATDNGATRIGLIRPQPALTALSSATGLAAVAAEIEEKLIQMVDESR